METSSVPARAHGAPHGGKQPGTSGEEPKSWVVLSVSDTGVGMDEATRSRVFEPFFTTKGVGKGTGLGLSSVYGIAMQNGGDATVESVEGRGSTFRLFLPATEGVEAGPACRAPKKLPPGPMTGGRRTILLVEDEPGVRTFARDVLSGEGHDVLVAGDADEAAAVWTRHRGAIDVLVTDVGLPGVDGGEVARRFALRYPAGRVAFISGYVGDVDRETLAVTGGAVFLGKPFAPDDLRRTLRGLLARA